MLNRLDIRIRDPFILTDTKNKCYYMYGNAHAAMGQYRAFACYKSYDLEHWEEPKIVFDAKAIDFWGMRHFWAPEVYYYNGKYYMFASFKADNHCRGTHVLVCDTPDGTFVPLGKEPQTPLDWECLDGTLYMENGKPYMVFCHEWVQVGDGEMCAIELSPDLSRAVSEPKFLFRATDEPIVRPLPDSKKTDFITDGPFLYQENGKLNMLWSSYTAADNRYVVLKAQADSLFGKWEQLGSQFDFDGGHAMLFTSLEGKRMIALHSPNTQQYERLHYFEF